MPRSWRIIGPICFFWLLSAQGTQQQINRPEVASEQKTESRVQYHEDSNQKARVRLPPDLEPPGLPTDQHASNEGDKSGEEGTEFWPPIFGYKVKITDSLLVLFTAVLAIVTGGLHVSTKRLWQDAREQTELLRESIEVAYIGLGRPYVLFEFIEHNFEEWRAGKDRLQFVFRFTNQGLRPAVVTSILATPFLSFGRGKGDSVESNSIKTFPEPNQITALLNQSGREVEVSFDKIHWEKWQSRKFLVIGPEKTTNYFRVSLVAEPIPPPPRRPRHLNFIYEATSDTGCDRRWAHPYLIGTLQYKGQFGRFMYTCFSIVGYSDGDATEYEEAPYNDLT